VAPRRRPLARVHRHPSAAAPSYEATALSPLLQRCLLLVISTLLGLVILEGGLTLFYADERAGARLEMVEAFRSPYVFVHPPGRGFNSLGMRRERAVSPQPLPGTRRILSYGDSISAGYRLAEVQTYSHRLEQALGADTGKSFEVLNMSRGHSPSVYAFHLRNDVPALQPRGVILEVELVNDTPDEAHVRTRGRDASGLPLELRSHRYILGWDGYLLAPITFSGSFLERTKVYAKISRWVGRLLHRLRPNPLFSAESPLLYYSHSSDRYFLTAAELARGFDRLFDTLAAIQHYLAARDIHFLVILLPSQYAYAPPEYREAARELLRRGEERARELGIPFVSLGEALGNAGGAELFMDFCHPTADGNRVIAQALLPLLADW
jgi:lysophospholipase L1-like esterase